MEEKVNKKNYIAITVFICLGLVLNTLVWKNQSIGLALGLVYILFYSFIFGSIFVAKKGWQMILGFTFLLSIISIIGALSIYIYQFNEYSYLLLISFIPALLISPYYNTEIKEKFSLKKILKEYLDKFSHRQEPKLNSAIVIIYLILTTAGFYLLALAQTSNSIQSPWQVVSEYFFIIYFGATLTLLVYLFNSTRSKLPLFLIILHSFWSSSVALIIYEIGYGFDPFIHQAAEKIISLSGTIDPKTPYYLGQYALVIFFQKLTFIDINLIDKILVPALFSLLLPPTIYYVFNHWLEKKYALVLSLSAMIIPYSSFIMTTPQNLANLFFIITILTSLVYFRNQIHVSVLYLLTLATLSIHPLAGIPLLVSVILFNLFKLLYTSYQKYISLFFLAASVFIIFLPLAFIANGSRIILNLPNLHKSDLAWTFWVNKFDLPLNLVYLIEFNKIILASIIILIGLAFITKNKLLKNNTAYLMAALIIFIDFLITKYFLTFPELRDFDANSFIHRLANLTFYILLPFFLLGLYFLIKKFWDKDYFTKSFIVLALSGLLTTSLYLSYPRLNQFEPAKFFSLSSSDIRAVNFIEQTANPNHIVLANQMVGVASIKEFGFKRYINGEFYYSMPNGNPRTFYQAFLDMTYQGAKRETMEVIMAQAGMPESYFVLNKYWRDFEKISAQAYDSADSVIDIDNGTILIFKYLATKTN